MRAALVCSGVAMAALMIAPPGVAAQGRYDREERALIVRGADGRWLVDLPPGMEDAIDRYDPDFEPWTEDDYAGGSLGSYEFTPRQLPWVVVGDFNGDGRRDAAIAGRTDRDVVVLLLLSGARGRFRAVVLEREPYEPDDPSTIRLPVLSYLFPGRYVVDDPRLGYPRELVVTAPAVELSGGWRPGAAIYVVSGGRVVPYYLTSPVAAPR